MRRFIITGAPGAGKTAVLRHLELDGFGVVEEAATDMIAAAHACGTDEPWRDPRFLDAIAKLQRDRQIRASHLPGQVQFHDRSVVCTAALADYLRYPRSPFLVAELARIAAEKVFEYRVFFVRNLGFVTPTAVRRITYEETLRFELIHQTVYREFGFDLVPVEPGSVIERVHFIESAI